VPENPNYPELPFDAWEPTKDTLHLYAQIVGKVRLRLAPRRNHWWHVPLYVSSTGLTTAPMPCAIGYLTIDFNFIAHRLELTTSQGESRHIALHDGLTVAEFYTAVFDHLRALGVDVAIHAVPFDHKSTIPFAEDREHHHYDAEYVRRYWQVLVEVDQTLKTFGARFNCKISPVHLFWHSFDLAVTWFSGSPAPDLPDADPVTRDAYSHEVISFGFWAGDPQMRFPAYYSYTYPEPPGLTDQPLRPDSAAWVARGNGSLALLRYEDARTHDDPRATVLAFLESAWEAGVNTMGRVADSYRYTES
jgi:hypothetical protein